MLGVSGEYKHLQKFAPGSDSHLFGEELEDSIKKGKDRHYSLQALKQSTGVSQAHKRKANADCHLASQKTTGQSKSPGLAKRVLHKQTNKQTNIWLQNTILISGKITEVTGIKKTHRPTDQPDSKP